MINGYGPTENTVSSTEFWVDKQYDNIPIGKSQRNVRSYIVDENLNRLPVGASGELCHSGRQIAVYKRQMVMFRFMWLTKKIKFFQMEKQESL